MNLEPIFADIEQARRELGTDVVILVHHYESDGVIRWADFRGDSLELSRVAAKQHQARYIVFCGVDFMAETAAMLCDPSQQVLLPAGDAPCPMAYMASVKRAQEAWDRLTALWSDDLVPITYQNSTAALKAFCGRHGGAVCTSSNAERLFRWALEQKRHLIFFPDEWLGTNSALALGIPRERIAVWDSDEPDASLAQARGATVVVWQGYCHVHTFFTTDHVRAVREQYPGVRVIVHPECPVDVVQAADAYGSTAQIIRYVEQAPAGSVIAIGTEVNMVTRLGREYSDKTVMPLSPSRCGTMALTTPAKLRDTLRSCVVGDPIHVVSVDDETRRWANLALERMLNL
ncbi:MAG: quinolinate synthase NadA [Chloroflexi bacterium]|nr:quinolinate synthase NadA [Chloroflexota bacterium]MBU1747356.1 quinolinate synthase NadA [Chloroflexota bacterium]MBU1877816.1 quinolinate synthase NadA [Chloroflexota bacterium]